MRRRVKIGGIAAIAVAGLLASRSMTPTSDTSAPDDSAPTPLPRATPFPIGLRLESRDDMTQLTPVRWFTPEAFSPTTIRVAFWTGVPQAYGVNARVFESATEVRIELHQGIIPGAPEWVTQQGLRATVVVGLDAPLGDRTLTGQDG